MGVTSLGSRAASPSRVVGVSCPGNSHRDGKGGVTPHRHGQTSDGAVEGLASPTPTGRVDVGIGDTSSATHVQRTRLVYLDRDQVSRPREYRGNPGGVRSRAVLPGLTYSGRYRGPSYPGCRGCGLPRGVCWCSFHETDTFVPRTTRTVSGGVSPGVCDPSDVLHVGVHVSRAVVILPGLRRVTRVTRSKVSSFGGRADLGDRF